MKNFFVSHVCMILSFCLFSLFSFASNDMKFRKNGDKEGLFMQLEAGYLFGGQLYNDNFIYNPGFKMGLGVYKELNERTRLGLNTGYYTFTEHEHFLPIKIEFVGTSKKNKECPYFNFSMGYAFGWDEDYDHFKKYDYDGGIQIGAGLGRRVNIKKTELFFGLLYEHQFAKLNYELFEQGTYTENLNYDWITINCKIMF